MENKLVVSEIGDFEQVGIIEILVKKGDKIKKNDSIVTLESGKSSVEVPSVSEGKVDSINVKIGNKVSSERLILPLLTYSSKSVLLSPTSLFIFFIMTLYFRRLI